MKNDNAKFKIKNFQAGSKCHKPGFTLIELLIVISITIILAGATIPVFGGWQSMSQLNESKAQVAQLVRMARQYSLSGHNGSRHGVYFDISAGGNDKAIYYQGDSYAGRDSQYDLAIVIDDAVRLSTTLSNSEVNFSKQDGLPSSNGVIALENNLDDFYQLRVNELGVVTDNQ